MHFVCKFLEQKYIQLKLVINRLIKLTELYILNLKLKNTFIIKCSFF